MTDDEFPDRNLDVLRARVASGSPARPSAIAARGEVLASIEDLLQPAGGQVTIAYVDGAWKVTYAPTESAPSTALGSELPEVLGQVLGARP